MVSVITLISLAQAHAVGLQAGETCAAAAEVATAAAQVRGVAEAAAGSCIIQLPGGTNELLTGEGNRPPA